MEFKHWIEEVPLDEKDTVGWKTIQNLGDDIRGANTVLIEEEMTLEIKDAYEKMIRAQRLMRQALAYTVSELGFN